MGPKVDDGDIERCNRCLDRDGHVGRIVMLAAMYLENIARTGGGPYGAAISNLRDAWIAEDFDTAVDAWSCWLQPQIKELAEWRWKAAAWEIQVQAMIRTVAEVMEGAGGAGGQVWPEPLTVAWAELQAAWDSHDEYKVSRAASWWLRCALNGLIDGLVEREWRAVVEALPEEVRPLAGEGPPTRQAERTATTFELSEHVRCKYGIDLLGGENGEI
jgi:hypothetical protein